MNLIKLKLMCIKDHIPIVRDETILYIENVIRNNNFKNILEIGTGYGYSANFLCNKISDLKIDTIEKNINNFLIASSFPNKNINYILASAFDWKPSIDYDLIFIDGPKNKQEILFEKFSHNLVDKGLIIIDNIYLKDVKPINKNKKILLKKNFEFKKYLLNLINWNVKILDIDDGIAICKRINNEYGS